MIGQESTTDDILSWVDEETRAIDVVASWESLCDTYDVLRFTDRLSDADRLEEYRWIVQQMNIFLSKMRKSLLTCKDRKAMAELLETKMVPVGKVDLTTRKALVYQKLRQQWVRMAITRLQTTQKEEQDGWQD